MLTAARLTASIIAIAVLTACDAPPSVQKVIDEAEAQKAKATPPLDNPMQSVAQDEGREVYMRYLLGDWAPKSQCDNDGLRWTFTQDSFTRPSTLSSIARPCRLEVVEALNDGSYAIAGYCPRLDVEDEPVVLPLTRINDEHIIIPGVGGGALYACE